MTKLLMLIFMAALLLNEPVHAGWVAVTGSNLPNDAMVGGQDSKGQLFHICRARHAGGIHPGKLDRGGVCSMPYEGNAYVAKDFEVLVGSRYSWINEYNGNIPFDAVPGGKDRDGEVLYICRGQVKTEWHPGKTRKSFKSCNVPFEGTELKVFWYQILVGN